jgi:pimeloyl-ACP methyl ester carboxylesterase
MSEQLFKVNGIELCAESFGNPEHPAILMIMGAQASMVWWEKDFCRRLAAKGHFIIRYDNRDVGRSVTYEPGNPEYTFEDMTDDAIHILDHFGIAQAHIVGISMGSNPGFATSRKSFDRFATLYIEFRTRSPTDGR